jgi:hypothetical protein
VKVFLRETNIYKKIIWRDSGVTRRVMRVFGAIIGTGFHSHSASPKIVQKNLTYLPKKKKFYIYSVNFILRLFKPKIKWRTVKKTKKA